MECGENLFSGSLPTSLGRMSSLNTLVLHDNQLTGTLPDALGGLSSLTDMLLFNNQLTGSIPDSLGKLKKLSALALFNNKLSSWTSTSICSLITAGTLTECSLATNPLKCPMPACASACSATCT